jgi:biopolymer transport protein ExbD
MGASGIGGGKRSANAELNLVPYIDLLSTLICFLLLTAVYQQISSLSTQGAPPGTTDSASSPDQPKKVQFKVSILTDHLEMAEDDKVIQIPFVRGEPDFQALLEKLGHWKAKFPDRRDVTLNSDGQTPYKYLIRAMDTLVQGEFEDIGVNTN